MEPVEDVAVARPHPALRPWVERYVGYRVEGFAPGIHRGLPGPHLTWIVSLAEPVDIVAMPGGRQPPSRMGAFVSGYHVGPATIAHDGSQHGLSLDLTPAGARALLGLPAAALAGEVVELPDVLGRGAATLADRLAAAPGWPERFALLDAELLRRAARTRAAGPRPEVAEAWRRLRASAGRVEVGALAAELGWSRRHLGERFRDELGLTPKAAARVLRFACARALLGRPDRPALVDIASAAGYYDQAHLNRDFRELAGCSPGTWLAEELPSVQAAADLAG